ncbi:MAG: carbamate kinase [Candidatus Ureaplasma intestinipullorum]|uniref:Carbamate kinase n=1 Tax=Candidatus Ureaplasma intestinipullorum TaxID=2838770 RepID=A0A9E2KXA9_9BACT|nr:carbamate kinase [Candidatus Ureaplasma intestinipullorum]
MKIVIALGGNALGDNPSEQKELVKVPAQKVASLSQQGHTVVIGHGNGPQVGMIFNSFSDARKVNPKTPIIPFAEAGGMSQGYIGYHMLAAIQTELNKLNLNKNVAYFETLTFVDPKDPAFSNPTKPVGPFYASLEEAKASNPDSKIVEDAGRGYRVVVPSPKPIDFLGIGAIKQSIDNGTIAIVGGGGGIPAINENGVVKGLDGVIDKDFTCAKIAEKIDADVFVILTAVDHVYVNWGKPDQKGLEVATVAEMEEYISQNQFAPGSMLPKVQAAINFVKGKPGKKAIIADLKDIEKALEGKVGTAIVA